MSAYPPPPGGYPPPQGQPYPPSGAVPPYQQYPAPLPGQPGYQWGTPMPQYPYADFGQRLLGQIIDSLIVSLMMLVPLIIGAVAFIAGLSSNDGSVEVTNSALLTVGISIWVIAVIIGTLYEPILTARKGERNGQTVGRRLMHIRITNLQGGPIGAGQAWGRYLFKSFFSGSIFYLGYLWMLWDPGKQGWHDKVANTLVLRA